MTAEDIMTPHPVALRIDRSIREAITTLDEHQIRHLPVIEDGRLVGILSDRSVAPWRLSMEQAESWHDIDLDALLTKTPVGQIIERRVVFVRPDTSLSRVIDRLLSYNIGAVPVIDARDELVGIISYVDLLRHMQNLVK